MDNFVITHSELDSVTIYAIEGYFTQPAGEQLKTLADTHLRRDKSELVLDLSKVLVINSPGVAGLLDLVLHVLDDLEGAVYLVGLDKLKSQVLTMAGIIPLATSLASVEEAIRAAKN